MTGKLVQKIENTGYGEYRAVVDIYDSEMNLLGTYEKEFQNANEVYAGYRGLRGAVRKMKRYGIREFIITSTCESIIEELNGAENENNRLLQYFLDDVKRIGAEIVASNRVGDVA